MIRNFASFSQTNAFQWKIFLVETIFIIHANMQQNYFPMKNILQACETFVLFICSLSQTFSFFILMSCITSFAFVEYSENKHA